MTYRVLLLLCVVPALACAAETGGSGGTKTTSTPKKTTTTTTSRRPATTAPASTRSTATSSRTPKAAPRSAVARNAPGVNTSDTVWRLQLGYGFTSENLTYSADATPDAAPLPGYAAKSTSSSQSASASSIRLDVGPMYGVHPASRGQEYGFLWGIDLGFSSYKKVGFTLPMTDADTTATTQNGRTFKSDSTLQTVAVGPSAGMAWEISPQLSVETLGFLHLGILHSSYTSGENNVYGKNAPLALFNNDLYNLYYDLGVKVDLAYRFINGWEMMGTLGYIYGQSLKGKISDSVTFYQGAANAQTGSYNEQLQYKITGPFLDLGVGYSF